MNKKSKVFVGAGLSSIMLVFVLLCLITFSLLSLSSANTDRRLSIKAADRTRAYYEACSGAAKRQQEIADCMKSEYNSSMTEAEYLQMAETALKNIGYTVDADKVSFLEDVGEEEELYVELELKQPSEKENTYFKITAWKTRQKGEWKADQTLPVMQKQEVSGK